MKRRVLTIVAIIVAALSSMAQLPALPSSQLSPNATSLGEYGEVPVSLFSGIPQIEIPLYTIEAGDHQVPISLSYHGGGVKVDQHPGWTGLGWTLMAGGSISRTVNGQIDEFSLQKQPNPYYGQDSIYVWGNYYRQGMLDSLNFNSESAITGWINTNFVTPNDPNKMYIDAEPDKFSFNFLGYSGNFWLDGHGGWKVQCDKDIKVELGYNGSHQFSMQYNGTATMSYGPIIPGVSNIDHWGRSHTFLTFTITGEDGTKYVFGENANAVEYSLDFFSQDTSQTNATTWNLSRIEYPDGRRIMFFYDRGPFIAQFGRYFSNNGYAYPSAGLLDPGASGFQCQGDRYSGSLIFPSYLNRVNAELSFDGAYLTADFSRSVSEAKTFDIDSIAERHMALNGANEHYFPILRYNRIEDGFRYNQPISYEDMESDALKWQKLDGITLVSHLGTDSAVIKRIAFDYTDIPYQRLTLNSVSFHAGTSPDPDTPEGGQYSFEYDNVSGLPPMLRWKTDHWGFCNQLGNNTGNCLQRVPTADPTIATKGSLSKIIYPTGGYTRLEYGLNQYSRQVSEDHTQCSDTNQSVAGGIRIDRLINSPTGNADDEYMAKRYVYKRDGSASSGVLLRRARYSYAAVLSSSTNPSQPATVSTTFSESVIPCMDSFGGAHIGYSEVTEILPDSSSTVYKYTNIDNTPSSLDQAPDASIQTLTPADPYTTHSQERGLLIEKEEYDSLGHKTAQTTFTYEKDDTTSGNFVKSIMLKAKNYGQHTYYSGVGYRFPTYSMRPVAQYDTIFDGNNFFATRTLTEYNPQKLVSKTTRSVGPATDEVTHHYYTSDRASVQGERFSEMSSAHILSPIVETIVTRTDGNTTSRVSRQFNHYADTGGPSLHHNVFKPTSIDLALDNNAYYQAAAYTYDGYFNPKSASKYGVLQQRFLWEYSGKYPIAVCDNENSELALNGNSNLSQGIITIAGEDTIKSLTKFGYRPYVGIIKKTDCRGDLTTFAYDGIGRYVSATNSDGNLLEKYEYHFPTSAGDKAFVANSVVRTAGVTSPSSVTLSNSVTDTGFYDGLGRKLQTVSVGAATSGGDIADYTEYDATGSPVRQWLPAVGSGSGAFTPLSSLQYSGAYSGGNYSDFHTQIFYENRPSHRPTEVRQAGTDWLNADGTRTYYKINTSAANGELTAMWLRLTSSGGLEKAGTYPAGNLLVTKTVDEDGCPLWTFTDKAGNKVLERRQPDTSLPTYADTYFVHDSHGNVKYAISPEGSKLIAGYADGEISASDIAVANFSYTYQYDHRNRLYGKKRPGIMPENFLFDNLDRVRFSNDGNHNIAGRWIATEYDRYNRVAFTADFATTKTYSQLRSSVLQTNENVALTGGSVLGNGKIFGYTITQANTQNLQSADNYDIISVNYYDDYGFLNNFAESGDELVAVKNRLGYQAMTGYGTQSASARAAYGLTTGTVRRVLWPEGMEQPASAPLTKKYVFSANYYDSHGRLIQSRETNLLGGQENYYYDLSFTGKPLRVRHEHVTADTTITEITTYTYDNRDRLVATAHNFGNDTPTTLQADQLDALGRVATRHLGGNGSADALTSVAYGYDLHGNVASITSDKFSQTLRRERRGDNSAGLLNGNICEQEFTLVDHATPAATSTYGGTFTYEYDKMNRLTKSSSPSFWHGTYFRKFHRTIYDECANRPDYSERVSYDLNTNIKSFSRRGFLYDTSAGKYYGLLDSLTVYYGGNQVRLVTDAVTTDYGHPAEYRDGEATWYEHNHDKNGNLVCDLDRGVTSIGYNILNLPEKVLLHGNHETYNIYDADGRKLRTVHIVIYDEVVTPGGETIIPADTLVRDYSGGHIYENGVLERTLTPTGYYSSADSQYCYYIKDYQGNNIAVVKADANGVPEVVSVTLMYPFGGELTEMSATDRYRFGGKELDTRGGLFHYDFDARWYDPVFPAFTSVDPMAEKYPHLSPYAYCAGNPIRYIDPNGMEWDNSQDESFALRLSESIMSKLKSLYRQIRDKEKKLESLKQSKKRNNDNKTSKIESNISDLVEQKNELINSMLEICEMGTTKEKAFTISCTESPRDKGTINELNNGAIEIVVSGGTYENAIHEFFHAYDCWRGNTYKTIEGEIHAYKRQYSFNKYSMPQSVYGGLKSIFDVDDLWLLGVYDSSGDYVYKFMRDTENRYNNNQWMKIIKTASKSK